MIKILLLISVVAIFILGITKLLGANKKENPSKRTKKIYFSGEVTQFWYASLTPTQQELYDLLVGEIKNLSFEINLEGMGFFVSAFDGIQKAILYDHPEIFWVDSFLIMHIQGSNEVTSVKIQTRYDRYEIENRKYQIDRAADRIIRQVKQDMDDFEKALAIHDIIINETSYGSYGTNDQHIDSVLIDHYSVCAGYSKTYQYLLNIVGIDAATISGYGNSDKHAWNLVCLDGDYYYIDVTWDDPTYTHSRHRHEEILSHDYFAVTTEEILRTHTFEYDRSAYPTCSAVADNYYVRKNRYYTSANELVSDMKDAFRNGEDRFECKLNNHKEIHKIIRGSLLSSIGLGSITYSVNEDVGTLTVARRS